MVRLASDKTVNYAASHARQTHTSVRRNTFKIGMEARGNLEQHRHAGDARIDIARGGRIKHTEDVDLLVVLSDERGLGAAMSIEFGREEGTTSSWGPMDATNILHEASGLKGRGHGRVKRTVRDKRKRRR